MVSQMQGLLEIFQLCCFYSFPASDAQTLRDSTVLAVYLPNTSIRNVLRLRICKDS